MLVPVHGVQRLPRCRGSTNVASGNICRRGPSQVPRIGILIIYKNILLISQVTSPSSTVFGLYRMLSPFCDEHYQGQIACTGVYSASWKFGIIFGLHQLPRLLSLKEQCLFRGSSWLCCCCCCSAICWNTLSLLCSVVALIQGVNLIFIALRQS
jgi:hypothetical protein